MSQTESRQAIAANRLIDGLMKTVLGSSPNAARLRLTIIRFGTDCPRYDVVHSVVARGRWIGQSRQGQPLSDWSDFLPALLARQCALHQIRSVRLAVPAFGFPTARPSRVLVCPVAGADGPLLGAIFVVWDHAANPSEHAALSALTAVARRVAMQIAAILDLCGSLTRQPPDRISRPA